jgi:peptide-methionine (S)-S-oxide reductase
MQKQIRDHKDRKGAVDVLLNALTTEHTEKTEYTERVEYTERQERWKAGFQGNEEYPMKNYVRELTILVVLLIAGTVPVIAAEQKAVFAGGCFWGVEAVFEHVKGVIAVRSGYAGGTAQTANYRDVSSGETKHAESVEIRFDPAKVSYVRLLNIFFAVAHDPTEVNRQGPDIGTQYRSVIFYTNADQQRAANAFITALNSSKALGKPAATQVVRFVAFFAAEDYHQDFLKKNPEDPYIVAHDLPKLSELKTKFPELYRAEPAP